MVQPVPVQPVPGAASANAWGSQSLPGAASACLGQPMPASRQQAAALCLREKGGMAAGTWFAEKS